MIRKKFKEISENENTVFENINTLDEKLLDWLTKQFGWENFLNKFSKSRNNYIIRFLSCISKIHRKEDGEIYIEIDTWSDPDDCSPEFSIKDLKSYFGYVPSEFVDILEETIRCQELVKQDHDFIYRYLKEWIPVVRDDWKEFLAERLNCDVFRKNTAIEMMSDEIEIDCIDFIDGIISVSILLRSGLKVTTRDFYISELYD